MAEDDARERQHEKVLAGLNGYGASNSELGRKFARRMRMHPTDSAAIVEILQAEDRGRPLTPARLAERTGMTSSATSILLNRLETAGHITRQRGHADRRLVTLRSTATVHDEAGKFFEPVRAQLDEVMKHYSPDQLALVALFVSEVRNTLESYARDDED